MNAFPSTLSSLLEQSIQRFPDSIALQLEEQGILTRYTYAELELAVKAAAKKLKGLGIEPGMRVILLSENRPELVITFLALLSCQATAVILDTALETS
ncbi:MAG: AMP-binding protein, partial [Gammaproteobacteria bacterium]